MSALVAVAMVTALSVGLSGSTSWGQEANPALGKPASASASERGSLEPVRGNEGIGSTQTPGELPDRASPVAADARPMHGLERASSGRCRGLYRVVGTDDCSHGPDELDVAAVDNGDSIASTTSTVQCDGDGSSGNRVLVMYVRAADVPNRYSEVVGDIKRWAAEVDNRFDDSAAKTGGSRHVRYVHSADCRATVVSVTLTASGDDSFADTKTELASRGYNRKDRKYMIFMDRGDKGSVYCGIGSFRSDDRPGSDNSHNFGPMYGRTDNKCWGSATPAHELMHNLGGVQASAPHSDGGHCWDEYDRMCYKESGGPDLVYVCPSAEEGLFDCRNDDYFNTRPAAGSYLAKYWNTANNTFLIKHDHTPPSTPTGLAVKDRRYRSISLAWSASTDSSAVDHYNIYNRTDTGAVKLAESKTTSALREGLLPGRSYTYSVSAVDTAGNESSRSSWLTVATLDDTTSPTTPTNLAQAGRTTSSVKLSWTSSTDGQSGVNGYKIHRWDSGTSTWEYVRSVSGNSGTISSLVSGRRYYFRVTSYDYKPNTSTPSGWISATTG